MSRHITRRDFMNGMGIGIGGLAMLPSTFLRAQPGKAPYPPALTGLRGSHVGSFEYAHALRDGQSFTASDTGENYDLVIVGAGISGLAAAWFFRQSAGPDARILILDNHDDFGGHAKRNEFMLDGRRLLVNGGTLNMEQPSLYSPAARSMIQELGIDVEAYQKRTEGARSHHRNQGLNAATFFDRETFGEDRLVKRPSYLPWADFVAQTPLAEQAKLDLVRLSDPLALPDYLTGLSDDEKKMRLARMSYRDYLLNLVGVHPDVILFYQTRSHFTFYMGPEQVPALYAWQLNYPGFQGLGLLPSSTVSPLAQIGGPHHGREYEYDEDPVYFPDGNATITRLLVRSLIPYALPGDSFEDSITAMLDYSRLDRGDSRARIRLNSTVTEVKHAGDPEQAQQVDITYIQDGRVQTVHAGHCVMACWHTMIPHLCPELPQKQKEALGYGIKAPRVYTNVLLRDSRAFARLGVRSIDAPGSYHSSTSLQTPLSVGDYEGPRSASEPIVARMHRAPCAPGLPRREQLLAGRRELLSTTFETFESNIREQLDRMLSPGGFDANRDIAAITVNRWPHGNAYIYNTLTEPVHWALYPSDDRPCVIARQPFGRLTFANSDAGANPFTDVAIDQAHRAIGEVLEARSKS